MNCFTLRAAATLLVFMLATAVQSQTPKPKDTWTKVTSKNFTLVGNASEKEIRQVGTQLEQFREVFTKLLSLAKFDSPIPTTVIVFKSMSSYKPFNPKSYYAYFQKGPDVNYVTLTADARKTAFAVIYHEYVHIMLNNTAGNVPVWFHEGLAEYYSTFLIEDNRIVHVGELIEGHLQTLRQGKLFPLAKLFAVDHDSPDYNERDKNGMFYAEAWALVHYLMLGNSGQRVDQLGKYLELIAAHTKIEEAFKLAFKIEMSTLEKELKRYIESDTFHMQFATFHKKLEFDKEFTASPLTEAEGEAYLGDLALHINDLAAAETHLQQALALDPKLNRAHTSLGMVRVRQDRFTEAQKALAQAVTDPASNYLTHYYYAYALSKEGEGAMGTVNSYPPETIKIMRAELRRAIELNPAYPESYYLLAFVHIVAGEQMDEAAELLNKAIKLSPGRQDLVMELGQLYLRLEKFDLAIQTLQPLRESQDSSLKKQAEVLIQSIERLQRLAAERNAASQTKASDNTATSNREAATSLKNDEKQPPPRSESDEIFENLRSLGAGEQRLQGTFLKLDCDNKGVAYLTVQASNGVHRIRAVVLDSVVFRTFIPTPQEMACGVRTKPENVVVTYRTTTNPVDARAKIDGDAVAVELVPNGFKLKP